MTEKKRGRRPLTPEQLESRTDAAAARAKEKELKKIEKENEIRNVTFKMRRDLHKQLKSYAVIHDLDMSTIIDTALRQFLND